MLEAVGVNMSCCRWLLVLLSLTGSSSAAETTERNCSLTPPYIPSTAQNTTLQLQELRKLMLPWNISAYIIPSTDAHLSEYIAPRDARMSFMTGFSGSAGTAVVTQTRSVLWTDSRYWLQAEREMDCNWELERDGSALSVAKWLVAELPAGSLVGFNPFVFSLNVHDIYSSALESSERSLKSVPENLVDVVWKDRPPVPPAGPTCLPDQFIQRSWQEKVVEIREVMKEEPLQPSALLLSALDETAWIFNMRGHDIPYNPFFYSYTLLTLDQIWLFVHMERVSEELKVYLSTSCDGPLCVTLKTYDSFLDQFKAYVEQPGSKVWVGAEYTNYAAYETLSPETLVMSKFSPVLIAKAVKDETEQKILRDAHVRDAVAVVQLLMFLEKQVPGGKETELTAALYVNDCRSKQKDNKGQSFATISASGPNAALAHYFPTNTSSRTLSVDEMFLVDSGGQYLDGTTDITRTVHWGEPTSRQKEAFTRVLMGNIELSRTIFPSGTRGINMELLARRALWEVGLNYGHGTGHGVGNYFGVHEWPVGFQGNNIPFTPGMFMSIEPGFYKENDFGIRIEDVVVTVPMKTKYGQDFLTFETVSLVPYDKKLIDTSLLSPAQLQWLNNYYRSIRETVSPELDKQGLKEEKTWLMKNTEPFSESGSGAFSSSSLILLALVLVLVQNQI